MTSAARHHYAPLGPARIRVDDLVRLHGSVGIYRVRSLDYGRNIAVLAHTSGQQVHGEFSLNEIMPLAGGADGPQ